MAIPSSASEGVWPLQPQPDVVRGFDPPAQDWQPGHRGVDLRGSPGQSVRAAKAGLVVFAGRIAGRGNVVVSHGGTRTTYQPVTASVQVGDRVSAGARIGSLVRFGSHCWPATCLHWGLIHEETYLNPLTLVGAVPVRLLPLFGSLAPAGPGPSPPRSSAPSHTSFFPPREASGLLAVAPVVGPMAAPVTAATRAVLAMS